MQTKRRGKVDAIEKDEKSAVFNRDVCLIVGAASSRPKEVCLTQKDTERKGEQRMKTPLWPAAIRKSRGGVPFLQGTSVDKAPRRQGKRAQQRGTINERNCV